MAVLVAGVTAASASVDEEGMELEEAEEMAAWWREDEDAEVERVLERSAY